MDRARAAADGRLPLDACATDTQSIVNRANYVWSAAQAGDLGGALVLDVGCGPGYGSDHLAARARLVLGVDTLPLAVVEARRRYRRSNLHFLVMAGERLGLGDACVDLAVSHETLMLVERDDAFVAELARVLRPGGLAVVSVPWNPLHRETARRPAYRREYAWESFERVLRRHFAAVSFHGRRLGERLGRLERELDGIRSADRLGLRRIVPRALRHTAASLLARSRGLPALGALSTDDVEYFEGTGESRSLIALCRGPRRG